MPVTAPGDATPSGGRISNLGGLGKVYYDPNAPWRQIAVIPGHESSVPAGWVFSSGMDGAIDRTPQTFRPGAASGGYPAYSPDGEPITQAELLEWNGTSSAGIA